MHSGVKHTEDLCLSYNFPLWLWLVLWASSQIKNSDFTFKSIY